MPFLPANFTIPILVETERCRIRPLTIHDAFKDYDAVMSSQRELWNSFGSTWGWPRQDHSLEQNIIDLGWHHKEFQKKSSLAYTIVNALETQTLGCIYIDPPTHGHSEPNICFWVRSSELETGLNDYILALLLDWLKSSWPFKSVTINEKPYNLATYHQDRA